MSGERRRKPRSSIIMENRGRVFFNGPAKVGPSEATASDYDREFGGKTKTTCGRGSLHYTRHGLTGWGNGWGGQSEEASGGP